MGGGVPAVLVDKPEVGVRIRPNGAPTEAYRHPKGIGGVHGAYAGSLCTHGEQRLLPILW